MPHNMSCKRNFRSGCRNLGTLLFNCSVEAELINLALVLRNCISLSMSFFFSFWTFSVLHDLYLHPDEEEGIINLVHGDLFLCQLLIPWLYHYLKLKRLCNLIPPAFCQRISFPDHSYYLVLLHSKPSWKCPQLFLCWVMCFSLYAS